jgi:uncharacterized membrane protein
MTDTRLEKMVALVLRTGVIVAAVVVLGGGLCYLIQHGSDAPGDRAFHGVAAVYRNPRAILIAAVGGDCLGIIQLGLLLLIATPVVRVALSLAGFALERDRTYVTVTAIVLVILLISLIGKI